MLMSQIFPRELQIVKERIIKRIFYLDIRAPFYVKHDMMRGSKDGPFTSGLVGRAGSIIQNPEPRGWK